MWGDLTLKFDEDNHEYLQWNERKTKTRTGNAPNKLRPFQPKIFPNTENSDRCPIAIYKEFKARRPDSAMHDDSPFYLAIKHNRRSSDDKWYKNAPLGEKELSKILKSICQNASIPGRKTNHSVRKTTVSNLLHAGVAPNMITQLTGHANVNSINNYAVASKAQQQEMSNILQNPASATTTKRKYNFKPTATSTSIGSGCSTAPASPQGASSQGISPQVADPSGSELFHNAVIHGGVFHIHLHTPGSPPRKARATE